MAVGYQILQVARINSIIQALQDVRTLPGRLSFLNRTPVTPAVDAEIMARFIGYIQVADLIADDERAVTYSSGKLSYESTNIPNIKLGMSMTQAMLNQLQSINANGGIQNDGGIFSAMENRTINALLLGIRQRMEILIIAMQLDALNYNRLGIVLNGATWGMPSDLKVTPSVTWDTAATATPVNDILTLKRYASVRYGEQYDRITMSTAAFIYMIGTTEFQNKVRWILPVGAPSTVLPLQDTETMKNLARSVLGMQLELYDERFWSQAADGTFSNAPGLPINKVILADSQDDNNPEVMDFASGICTETLVASMVPNNIIGDFAGPQRGPIAYATANDANLNPPGVTYWGVSRGFPRKHRLQATSVLTVGTFVDPIPYTNPF